MLVLKELLVLMNHSAPVARDYYWDRALCALSYMGVEVDSELFRPTERSIVTRNLVLPVAEVRKKILRAHAVRICEQDPIVARLSEAVHAAEAPVLDLAAMLKVLEYTLRPPHRLDGSELGRRVDVVLPAVHHGFSAKSLDWDAATRASAPVYRLDQFHQLWQMDDAYQVERYDTELGAPSHAAPVQGPPAAGTAVSAQVAALMQDPAVIEALTRIAAAGQPAVSEPVVSEPVVSEPAVLQHAVSRPAVVQPAAIQPAVSQPAVVQPAVAQPALFALLLDGAVRFGHVPAGSASFTWDDSEGMMDGCEDGAVATVWLWPASDAASDLQLRFRDAVATQVTLDADWFVALDMASVRVSDDDVTVEAAEVKDAREAALEPPNLTPAKYAMYCVSCNEEPSFVCFPAAAPPVVPIEGTDTFVFRKDAPNCERVLDVHTKRGDPKRDWEFAREWGYQLKTSGLKCIRIEFRNEDEVVYISDAEMKRAYEFVRPDPAAKKRPAKRQKRA
jgi:hypothetical protein